MFQINEKHIIIGAVISFLFLLVMETAQITALSQVRILIGLYLLLIPAGFLFISALLPRKEIGKLERLLLSISLSIPLNTSAILGLYLFFKVQLNFFNNLIIIFALCILFYLGYFIQVRYNISIKKFLGGRNEWQMD